MGVAEVGWHREEVSPPLFAGSVKDGSSGQFLVEALASPAWSVQPEDIRAAYHFSVLLLNHFSDIPDQQQAIVPARRFNSLLFFIISFSTGTWRERELLEAAFRGKALCR